MDPREYLNDNEEAHRLAMDSRQSGMWTAMPCIVQSVNWTQMTMVCQLSIQGRWQDQTGMINWVNISPIQDVPIVFPSGGGFSITFPLDEGDEVLVLFASRCIDAWWQNGGYANRPMEYRMHDLSDGFAIPGPKSVPNVIGSISSTDLQIRDDAGTTFLTLTNDGRIRITSAASDIAVVGNVNITGALTVTGEVTAHSGATAIGLSTHHHSGVTTGSGTSGGPVP